MKYNGRICCFRPRLSTIIAGLRLRIYYAIMKAGFWCWASADGETRHRQLKQGCASHEDDLIIDIHSKARLCNALGISISGQAHFSFLNKARRVRTCFEQTCAVKPIVQPFQTVRRCQLFIALVFIIGLERCQCSKW